MSLAGRSRIGSNKDSNLRYFPTMLYTNINDFSFIGNNKVDLNVENSKKILLIQLGTIGDLILATPFYEAIADKFPNDDIEIICSTQNYFVLKHNPRISKIHVFNKNWLKVASLIFKLQKTKYEYYIDPKDHISSQSKLFGKLIRAKTKIGFDTKGKIFDVQIPSFNKEMHFTDIIFQAGKSIGITKTDNTLPVIFPNLKIDGDIQKRISERPTVTLNISASKKSKLWELDHWKKLIQMLPKDFQYFLSYAPSEKQEAKDLLNLYPNLIDLNSKSLFDVISLVKYSQIVLTIDTAVVHIAAAFDKPLVGLFGGIDREFVKFAPLSSVKKVLRNPQGKDGVNEIAPERVYNEFMELARELGFTT